MAGDALRISSGPVEVELLPGIGGRLHRIRAFGHDLLRSPDSLDPYLAEPVFWGAYVMAPWCNRLAARPTNVGERVVSLPASFPDGTAIHGQVATAPWTVENAGDSSVTLAVRGGGDGWPWPYDVRQAITVADAQVVIELTLANLADDPMPAGLGLHPWFVKPLEARVAASQVVPSNLSPGADPEPVAGELDLREMGRVPDDLDATWTDLDDPPVELRWPAHGVTAVVRVGSDAPTAISIAIASPAALDAVAIEPQTHLPGGLRRFLAGEPGGLRLLDPGASMRLEVELHLREAG